MTKWRPNVLLKSHIVVMITFVAPFVILVILYKELNEFIFSETALKYGSYIYPDWAFSIRWALVCASVVAIPLAMCHEVVPSLCSSMGSSKSLVERLRHLKNPTDLWWKNSKDHFEEKDKLESKQNGVDPDSGVGHDNTAYAITEF